MMMNDCLEVRLVVESTGNVLQEFMAASLGEVPHRGDMIDFSSYGVPGEIISRQLQYREGDDRKPYVSSVSLLVRYRVERWLFLWKELVEEIRDSLSLKALRKSNRFLSRNAGSNEVCLLLRYPVAFGIDRNGQYLLEQYTQNYYE